MFKSTMFVGVFVCFAIAQQDTTSSENSGSNPYSGNDLTVLQSVLEQCGLKDIDAARVATIADGKVIALDLTNPDVSKDGLDKIPADIGKLINLQQFVCKQNIISVLPPEIGNLINLKLLDLSSNRIEALPAEIGKLESLVDLDLRHNRFEALPAEIGHCKKLKYLRLWGNHLTVLTEAITTLPVLKELYLKDNRLESLPLAITSMKSLVYVDFIGNKLCNINPKLDAWIKKKDKKYREAQKCW